MFPGCWVVARFARDRCESLLNDHITPIFSEKYDILRCCVTIKRPLLLSHIPRLPQPRSPHPPLQVHRVRASTVSTAPTTSATSITSAASVTSAGKGRG